jgi:hypothetical protein
MKSFLDNVDARSVKWPIRNRSKLADYAIAKSR